MAARIGQLVPLLKLRIGFAIAASALAGMAVAEGPAPSALQAAGLALAVLGGAGAAGAFNHYYERDTDRYMTRTRQRPFANGSLSDSPWWVMSFALLLAASVALAVLSSGPMAALYVFLGAATYGLVYTVWLKRRTAWNIVVGGLAGSFAVLAGAAAVDPTPQLVPIILAIVLFLWTPPHFWSLAAARRDDYKAARVPMLPIVMPERIWTLAIVVHTAALVGLSLLLLGFGLGPIYGLCAATGGSYFLWRTIQLYREPSRDRAMASFKASLIQLLLLVVGVVADTMVT